LSRCVEICTNRCVSRDCDLIVPLFQKLKPVDEATVMQELIEERAVEIKKVLICWSTLSSPHFSDDYVFVYRLMKG
jgi:hypothetical protein